MTNSKKEISLGRIAFGVFLLAVIVVSDIAIFGVALRGRISINIFGHNVLKAEEYWQSILLAVVCFSALIATFRRDIIEKAAVNPRCKYAAALAVILFAMLAGLRGPHEIFGDGRDYILQTQSLVFERSLALNSVARGEYWNRTNPYGIKLGRTRDPSAFPGRTIQAGGRFSGYYSDKFGAYRNYHFWFYPAAVAPIYGILHLLDPGGSLEYMAFRLFNAAMLVLFMWLCFSLSDSWPAVFGLMLMLFSPLIPYCDWQHPELFCLALAMLSFALALRSDWACCISPLFLGIAAAHNLPILLFFPFHIFLAIFHGGYPLKPSKLILLAFGYALGLLAGLSSIFYNLYYFGTASLIAKVGAASLKHATIERTLHIFFSPLIGAVWFFPFAFFALPACVRRRNAATFLLCSASVFAAAWLASSASNFNAGQIGPVRYAVWLLAPLWFFVFRFMPRSIKEGLRSSLLLTAYAASVAVILYFGSVILLWKNVTRASSCLRARSETAAIMRAISYEDDPETLVENIRGSELLHSKRYKDIYLWDLGKGKCLWILPKSVVTNGIPIVFEAANPSEIAFKAKPKQEIRFNVENNLIIMNFKEQNPVLKDHSVMGKYMTLRSSGHIVSVVTNQRYSVKSSKIKLRPPLETDSK